MGRNANRIRWAVLLAAAACWVIGGADATRAQHSTTAERFAVTSGHPDATAAGMSVLRAGGNVVDAAVATSLALGVAEPYGSGIGGKGMLLYRDGSTGRVWAIEAMGMASKSLDADKFAELPRDDRYYGYRSVAVPGLVAALGRAHEQWGSLAWRDVVRPAAELAEQGVTVCEDMYALMRPKRNLLRRDAEAARIYLAERQTPTVGSVMTNPDLARTLRRIADDGPRAFYEGEVAERIVAAAQEAGGPLALDDFRDYEARQGEPLEIEYEGYRVYSAPPPLTGGTTVLATLRALDGVAALEARDGRDAQYIDHVGRVLVALYPLVSRKIADVPTAHDDANKLCSEETARALRQEAAGLEPASADARGRKPFSTGNGKGDGLRLRPAIQTAEAGSRSQWQLEPLRSAASEARGVSRGAGGVGLPEASTSHLIVADRHGNVVSLTQSLSYHFGSGVVAPGTGVVLNNSMSNLATGRSTAVNYVGAGKRERSTIAPVVVARGGEPVLALGIPGGQRIPTTTIQLLIDVLRFGTPLEEAFARPRFHVQRPRRADESANIVDLEEDAPPELDDELAGRGWQPNRRPRDGHYFGGGSAVMYQPDGTLRAVADPRRTNTADGT